MAVTQNGNNDLQASQVSCRQTKITTIPLVTFKTIYEIVLCLRKVIISIKYGNGLDSWIFETTVTIIMGKYREIVQYIVPLRKDDLVYMLK